MKRGRVVIANGEAQVAGERIGTPAGTFPLVSEDEQKTLARLVEELLPATEEEKEEFVDGHESEGQGE